MKKWRKKNVIVESIEVIKVIKIEVIEIKNDVKKDCLKVFWNF
jgi:hypothetical protein